METSADNREPERFRLFTPPSLGVALRHFRKEAGLTQAELAERAGVHRTYLSDLECGDQSEQVRRLFRLFRELGVRVTLEKADW